MADARRQGGELYWGKIIGTLAGAATLKPWFALLGLLLGHQFDRGFAARFREFDARGRRLDRLPETFVRPLFQAMGHLAKADGRVSEAEIRAARSIMHRLGLGPAEVRKAIHWFDEGKASDFRIGRAAQEFRRQGGRQGEARTIFVRLLLEVALAKERFGHRERALLWKICTELDVGRVELAQLEAMVRAQKGFRRSPAGDADAARVRAAYRTLGVDTETSNEEIKRAYRRLMNRNHPDKIAGSNPDRAAVAAAERRTREIRAAYEMLKARRSIR